jgi:predicted nucleic acid-binding protein
MTGTTTAVLVDSSVLLDVLTEDSRWFEWSSTALADAAESHTLVINPVIYAEISVRFDRIEDLEAALAGASLERRHVPYEAAFLAGKCFLRYRSLGGKRTTALPDFFIGAHAAVERWALLTRDSARFRTYFPRLVVIAPE